MIRIVDEQGNEYESDGTLTIRRVNPEPTEPEQSTPDVIPEIDPTPETPDISDVNEVVINDNRYPITGVNVYRATDQMVIYTRTGDQTATPTNKWGVEATIEDGKITSLTDRQDTDAPAVQIPAGGLVLSGHGAARRWLLANAKVGMTVDFRASTSERPTTDSGNGDLPGNTARPSYVPSSAERIFLADARTGSVRPLNEEEAGGDTRIRVDGVRYRFEVRPGDYKKGIKTRSEAKTYRGSSDNGGVDLSRGRHITVFDQLFPKGYIANTVKTGRGEVIVMQYHGPNAGTSRYQGPILSMRTQDGQLEVVHQHYRDSAKAWQPGVIYKEPLQEGIENRWGIETVLAEKNGLIRIWKNGKEVKTINGYTYNEGVRSWLGFKCGLYDVPTVPIVVWYGNIAVYKLS